MGLKEAMEARKTATPTPYDDPDLPGFTVGPNGNPQYPMHDPMPQESWLDKMMALLRDTVRKDAPVVAKPIPTPTASPTPFGEQRQ